MSHLFSQFLLYLLFLAGMETQKNLFDNRREYLPKTGAFQKGRIVLHSVTESTGYLY